MDGEKKKNKKKLSQTTMRIDIKPSEVEEALASRRMSKTTPRRRSGARRSPVIKVQKDDPDVSRYTALLNGIYDAVLITDRAGTIQDMNGRALKLLDYDRDELLRLNVTDVLSGAGNSLINLILDNLEQHRYTMIDGHCRRSDGLTFPAEVAVNRAYLTEAGELCFFIRDITKRREMEEQLRQANKMKSLHIIAGGVAHDFNNLLTSVIGNTELALGMLSGKSKAREDLQVALDDAKKMAELSHRMIAYSGEGLFDRNEVDLNSVVGRALKDISGRVPAHVDIRMQLAAEPPRVGGEADVLAVLVKTLVMNAIEAIGDRHGTITVETSLRDMTADAIEGLSLEGDLQPGQHACLKVQDTGYGMDEVTIAKVLDPFFSTKGAGRGLGLSEAQGIVLTHDGAMAVESAIGRGATFSVWIPVFGESTAAPPTRTEAATQGISGSTILVIDDESSIRRYSRRILEKHGAKTILAEDGQEGVDQFRSHADEIDLVLLDMFMPKMNGDRVLKAVRKIRPGVKIIITSGYTESVYVDRFDEEQPSGFLYKPFATADFLKKIRTTLA